MEESLLELLFQRLKGAVPLNRTTEGEKRFERPLCIDDRTLGGLVEGREAFAFGVERDLVETGGGRRFGQHPFGHLDQGNLHRIADEHFLPSSLLFPEILGEEGRLEERAVGLLQFRMSVDHPRIEEVIGR